MKKNSLFIFLFSLFLSFDASAQNIFRTACQGKLGRLDSLLQNTSIDTVDDRGRSLLHWAVACKKNEVFDFLVKRGIHFNIADNEGATPMYMAVRFNNEPLLDSLLDLQMNSDWASNDGAALVERAILNKNLAIVRKLIEQGVDANVVNKRGSTSLEIAQRSKANEIAAWLRANGADQNLVRTFHLTGEYLGQKKPGLTATVFAPNFISTEESEFGSVFNAAGTEFYYGVDVNGKTEIRYSKMNGNSWTTPETILSHERYGYNDPFLSPYENRLYFISERALDGIGELKDHDIWYVEKEMEGWSEPINAGPNINSAGNEYYISFTKDGTMYFASNVNAPEERKRSDLDIYFSKYINGEFQEAVSLGDSINTDAYEADVFIDPNEQYIIFCSIRSEGQGRGDLYIRFKQADGSWTKSISMGEKINTANHELCPYVSHDGKFLFYTSDQDIYWISAGVIDELKSE